MGFKNGCALRRKRIERDCQKVGERRDDKCAFSEELGEGGSQTWWRIWSSIRRKGQ